MLLYLGQIISSAESALDYITCRNTLFIIHFRNGNIERHRIAWYILMVEDETVNRRFQITQNFCEFIISFLKGLDPFVLNFSPYVFDAGFPQVK